MIEDNDSRAGKVRRRWRRNYSAGCQETVELRRLRGHLARRRWHERRRDQRLRPRATRARKLTRATIDTNVFVSLFAGDEEASTWARQALEEAATRAALTVSPAVYAELVAGGQPEMVETFFSENGVSWEVGKDVWRAAGTRYGAYAHDRRQQGADPGSRRILADFLVGAHALHLGGKTLLTTDTRIFANYFPELRIIAPEKL